MAILELLSSIHSTNRKFHPNNLSTSNYHPKIHSCSTFIQIFHPFCNFHPCRCGFHLDNCFGINSIHTFQPIKIFIQIIHIFVIIIQKAHWCSIFIQFFFHFVTFIHVHVEKYFPHHFYVAQGYFKNILSLPSKYSKNIHSYSQACVHKLTLMLTCSLRSINAPKPKTIWTCINPKLIFHGIIMETI